MDLDDLVIKVYKDVDPESGKQVLFMKWEATIRGKVHGHKGRIFPPDYEPNMPWQIIRKLKTYTEHIKRYYEAYYKLEIKGKIK